MAKIKITRKDVIDVIKKRWWVMLIELAVLGIILLADLLTKKYAVEFLMTQNGQSYPLIKGFITLTYTENTGAGFGLFAGNTTALTVITAIVIVAVLVYLILAQKENMWLRVSLLFIVGGGIGNHSRNHLNMPKLSDDEIRAEIEYVNDRVNELTGIKPTYFRAPFGDYSDRLMSAIEELDMVGVQWSIDSLDWKGLSAKEIFNRVVPKAKSGDIVLFHNNSDHVLDALPLVLSALKEQGFEFVTLSELVATEGYTIDNNGIQHLD